MSKRIVLALAVAALAVACAQAQEPAASEPSQSTTGMEQKMPQPSMKDMPGMDSASADHAMHSMESHHMDMGPHMKMTTLRDPKPGDEERARKVVEAARGVAEKYKDYHTALAGGYKIFLPNVPQKMYHFTNYKYAFEAAFNFNPDHPT